MLPLSDQCCCWLHAIAVKLLPSAVECLILPSGDLPSAFECLLFSRVTNVAAAVQLLSAEYNWLFFFRGGLDKVVFVWGEDLLICHIGRVIFDLQIGCSLSLGVCCCHRVIDVAVKWMFLLLLSDDCRLPLWDCRSVKLFEHVVGW